MIPDLAMQHALDRADQVGFEALGERDQTLFCVWQFESKVANGGLAHFYKSGAADVAEQIPAAFRRVGATTRAEIAEKANAVFGPDGVPREREARKQALDALPSETLSFFDGLEQHFYEGTKELDERLEAYLARSE